MTRRLALLALAALALAGCGGESGSKGDTMSATTAVTAAGDVRELANVLDLRSDFEADAGKTRVVILFSPT